MSEGFFPLDSMSKSARYSFENLHPEMVKTYKNKKEEKKIVLMSKFTPVPYAEQLMADFYFIKDRYNRFWRYDPTIGIWREDADDFIKLQLRDGLLGEEQQKNNYVSEVVAFIKEKNYDPNFEAALPENIIPFKNCLFDLDKEEFIDFSPKYFVTSKLPVSIDPATWSDAPVIDAFFEDIVGVEYKIILYELCAYCLYRGYPYQKMFFLIGGGANGKSTFLELLRAFLGQDNVSSVSPQDMCNSQKSFALAPLWNKSANISSDISYKALDEVSKLKGITGEDTITIERKYKDAFPARIYAKLIFSTNQLPIVQDKSFAWYRRIYPIIFGAEFDKGRDDPNLKSKLTTERQLNGLAWLCIKILKDLKSRRFKFCFDPDINKVAELYEDMSDPLQKFLKDYTVEDADGTIFKFEFEERFVQWLKENRIPVWSQSRLGTEMKKKFGESRKLYPVHTDPPKQYWAWTGLKFAQSSINVRVSRVSPSLETFSIYTNSVSFRGESIDRGAIEIKRTLGSENG